MDKRSFTLSLGLALFAGTLGCTSLPQAYCEEAYECDELVAALRDPILGSSEDSIAVCAVNRETDLAALRANSERICHEIAEAFEIYMACVVEEGGCDPFRVDQRECNDEWEDWQDLAGEAGNRCAE